MLGCEIEEGLSDIKLPGRDIFVDIAYYLGPPKKIDLKAERRGGGTW